MFKRLKTSMFGRNKVSGHEKAVLMRIAKTEYSKDWQYAYSYMLENKGQMPKNEGGVVR